MRERYYLIFIVIGLVITLGTVFLIHINDLNTNIYTRELTVKVKYVDGSILKLNSTENPPTTFEIKDCKYLQNCTELYNSIIENQTYQFKLSFDTQTNMWNIISAAPLTQ